MKEWLAIIKKRDERIAQLETQFQQFSQEDKQKIDALQLEVDNYKAMIKQIAQGQDPIKVLVEGMGIMADLHKQITNMKADAMQRIEAEQKRIDGYEASYAQLHASNAHWEDEAAAAILERDLLRKACDEYEKHNAHILAVCGGYNATTRNNWVRAVENLKLEHDELKKNSQELYESLQSVMDVRDILLQHVYDLLDRPDGILLEDMPAAIKAHKAKNNKSNIVHDTDDSYGEHL